MTDQALRRDRKQTCRTPRPGRKCGLRYRKGLCAAMVAVTSLLYLSLPLFIFFAGWLRLVVAIPMILLLSTAISLAVHEEYHAYVWGQSHYGVIAIKHLVVLSLSGFFLFV